MKVMASNTQDSSSQSFWEGYKEFWGERFSFMTNYSNFTKRDKPLTSWSNSDVEDFIASDPVHGPVVTPFFHLFISFLHFDCLYNISVVVRCLFGCLLASIWFIGFDW